MFNSFLTFIKTANNQGKRIESNIQSVREKQIKHDSFANRNNY